MSVLFCVCYADTTPSAISEPVEIFKDDNLPANITLVINNPDNNDRISALENTVADIGSDNNTYSVLDNNYQLFSTTVSTERISASDANGFKAVLLGLLGDYESVITDYEYRNATGNIQHSIDVSPDFSWIGSCALFGVVIYCFMKMVGAFLCKQ